MNSHFPKIFLREQKIDAVKRFHPWIFSGAVARAEEGIEEGAIVEVRDPHGEYLATGFYSPHNIAVKILSFEPVTDIGGLFQEKFQRAYRLRQQLGLVDNPATNCYRLLNAEGDGLPGLIVDWYDGTAVIQASSPGVHARLDPIVAGLRTLYGERLRAIYHKGAATKNESDTENHYLFGSRAGGEVLEGGFRFIVDWEGGQKTGFFLDQRENRALLARFCAGKRVLNTFCYSGGFSVYALRAGASLVHSVDSSPAAIELTRRNVALNRVGEGEHETYTADVFDFLRDCDRTYDTLVLDPPAFAKSIKARHQATLAYRRLNGRALRRIRPDGILFTFSCSQVLAEEQFTGAVTAAAIEARRGVRILARLTAPGDHPTSLFHPEGSYLKGLVLAVD